MQQVVYALATAPDFANDPIVFAAGDQGVFRSADGGLHWQPAFAALELAEPLPATVVALSPAFATDRRVYAGAPGGVLASRDGGDTWAVTALPAPPPTVSALMLSPDFARDGFVIAGTSQDGVFRSIDRGAQWQPWNFGLLDLHVLCLAISPAFAADSTVFAGTESGIFRSQNGGRSWEECGFPTQLAPVLSLAPAPAFGHTATLYAGTEQHGMYRSLDGGDTWARYAPDAVHGAVDAIVAADELLVLGDGVLLAGDGTHWRRLGADIDDEPVAVAAPEGLHGGAAVLVAPATGGVRRIVMEWT